MRQFGIFSSFVSCDLGKIVDNMESIDFALIDGC